MPSETFRVNDSVQGLVLALVGVLIAVKLWLATLIPLFGDEAFYWLESRHPAVAYSDLPFMTALLVKAGTWLAGDSYLGVRLGFLCLGAVIPWQVYRLSRLLGRERDAIRAAGAVACTPLAATLGLLAVPDVPLVVFALAGLLSACRAVRSGSWVWWALAGSWAALGLCTHYRFAIWLIGPLAWLVGTGEGRAQWKRAGPWLGALAALAGLLPLLWFNLRHDMAGLQFQLVDRHPWSWQPESWRFLLTQILVVTPLMFAALAQGWWQAWRRSAEHDCTGLVLVFCILPLAVFSLAAFVADTERTSAHWLLAAYLPALAWLPAALRRWPRWLGFLAPVSGLAGTVLLLGWLAVAAWPERLGALTGDKSFPDNFTGWVEAADEVRHYRGRLSPTPAVLVAGNFMLGAELAFELGEGSVYVLNHPLNAKHGRALQLALWDLDEPSLRREASGEGTLIVLEDTALKVAHQPAWTRRLCSIFSDVDFLGERNLFRGRKRLLFFSGKVREKPVAAPESAIPSAQCDLPPFAYLATPLDGTRVSASLQVFGWAVEDNQGIKRVELLLDGKPVRELAYGAAWADVARFLPGSVDPNHPRVRFDGKMALDELEPGWHTLAVRVTTHDGNVRVLENRRIRVVAPPP